MTKCTRVYLNGNYIADTYEDHEIQAWLNYNKTYRPGCALFVNAECHHKGYLLDESCAEISKILKEKGK